ncbi:MAG: heavy metal translocating P-type ATPase [Casimicrobiaceae bacterium]
MVSNVRVKLQPARPTPSRCCDGDHADASVPSRPDAAKPPSAAATAAFLIQKMDCPSEERLIRDRLEGMGGVGALSFNLMPWVLLAIAGIAAVSAEVFAWIGNQERAWPVIALALIAILTGGTGTLRKGWVALRNRSLNMNFLMSIAVIGAAAIGEWPEAAIVIVLFALAELIEALSLDRARNAIKGLMAMAPERATVQAADGRWVEIPAADATVGALARVNPGERIPLDGIVVDGRTTVDQAPITGESIPVPKEPGDPVYAGTVNERGAFDYRVTSDQGHSTLARIIGTVQDAQGKRAPTQRFVDSFAHYYIPAVVTMAVLVALVPPLAMGAPVEPWVYKALVLLVIACPCALVISTPVTIVSGLAAAARRGILIKGGLYLEQGRKLAALALDKTGTITNGKPQVTDVLALNGGDPTPLLRRAASLARRSGHPVSTAVVACWDARFPSDSLQEVADVEALMGRGVKAAIGGEVYCLGNHRLVEELGMCSPALESRLDSFEREGKSVVVLCSATAPQLVLAVADTIRDSSRAAIARLQHAGVALVMLTGDNPHTAGAIARMVGIADSRGDLLPEDKLAAVSALVAEHEVVGMVGDGINDAPALARATIGFAMGAAGTDTALETADVALMDDDLRKLGDFIDISRKTHAILVQNIVLALGIKAVFLVLALMGFATLWMAVFADMGASLIVVFNGLRLLRPGERDRLDSGPATALSP